MCSDHMHTGSVQLFTHSVPSAFCFFEFSACKCAQLLPLHMSLYKPRLCPFAYVLLRLYETGCCLFSFAPSSCCSSIWLNFNKSWCIYVTQICIMRILKSPNKRFKKLCSMWNTFAQGESSNYLYILFLCFCIILSSHDVIFCHTVSLVFLECCLSTWHEQRQRFHCACSGYSGLFIALLLPFHDAHRRTSHCLFKIDFNHMCKQKKEFSLKHTSARTHKHTYIHEFVMMWIWSNTIKSLVAQKQTAIRMKLLALRRLIIHSDYDIVSGTACCSCLYRDACF